MAYEKILAEDSPELAEQYGIKQAPTLVVVKNGEAVKFTGVSAISGYLSSLSVQQRASNG